MNYFLKVTQSLSDGDHCESRHSGEEHNRGHKKGGTGGEEGAGGEHTGEKEPATSCTD